MALNNWEFSYNGLTFGGAQPYGLINIDGLSPPDIRIDEIERANDHGSYIYAQFLTARTITIDGDVTGSGSTDFEGKVSALRAAFAPTTDPQPLVMNIPGAEQKRIYCKPSKVSFPITPNYAASQYDEWTVELMAEDPRIYSDAPYNLDIFPIVATAGVGFNLAFNVFFGGTGGGGLVQVANNQGSFPSPPVVVLQGPVSSPILTNMTTGQALSLDITLDATQRLVIDFAARTILLNGYSSRYSSLMVGSRWWYLQPGNNTLKLNGVGIAGGTRATVTWRNAWN